MFLVFEGIDGSGTTTQTQLLVDFLRKKNIPVLQTTEPTNGAIGRFIRSVLSGKTKISSRGLQFLFCADRQEHLQTEILPALQEKKVVVSDRYFLSTLAYASTANDSDFFEEIAKHFPKPDLTIFLDVPVEIALKRIAKRGNPKEIFEKKEFLEKISDSYKRYIHKLSEEKRRILDGTKPVAILEKEIQKSISQKIVF